MKRELSPDPSGVGGGGAAVPGSADPRAHVAKVPRLEDPGSGALDRPPGHDASASIARATRRRSTPRAHRARWRPRSPPTPLSPTTTSAQTAARVIAAAAARASPASPWTNEGPRARPAVEACGRVRARHGRFLAETEIARSPLSAVAATTVVAAPAEACREAVSAPRGSRRRLRGVDAAVSPGPEPPSPAMLPRRPRRTKRRSDRRARGAAADADEVLADDTRRDVASNITRAPDDEPPAVGLVTNVSHRGDVKTDHLNDATVSVAATLGLPKDPHLRGRDLPRRARSVREERARAPARRRVRGAVPPGGRRRRRAPWDTNPYETIGPGYARAGTCPPRTPRPPRRKLENVPPRRVDGPAA